MVRSIQKKISLRRNEKSELTRRITSSIKSLEQMKQQNEELKNRSEVPEDFKVEAIKFMEQFIVAQEQTIDKLKKKIK